MEELKRIGYRTVLKYEDGTPRLIWACSIKKGQYGAFISVDKRWVTESNAKGAPVKTEYAGRGFNFPLDETKCMNMLTDIAMLVKKAVSCANEFKTVQAGIEEANELQGEETVEL